MLKKNDQIKIVHLCVNMMEFCQKASTTIMPDSAYSESLQETCKGLSKIFASLGEDFERIAQMTMVGFSEKEIKSLMAKSKKDFKKVNIQ